MIVLSSPGSARCAPARPGKIASIRDSVVRTAIFMEVPPYHKRDTIPHSLRVCNLSAKLLSAEWEARAGPAT